MNADVHESAEVDDISDGAGENHAGFQVRNIHDITAEDRAVQLLARVAAGLFKLSDDVVERVLADTENVRK